MKRSKLTNYYKHRKLAKLAMVTAIALLVQGLFGFHYHSDTYQIDEGGIPHTECSLCLAASYHSEGLPEDFAQFIFELTTFSGTVKKANDNYLHGPVASVPPARAPPLL